MGCVSAHSETPSIEDKASRPPSSRPLWELGLFTAYARMPHYRGSDETKTYLAPIPFFIYRGRFFQSSREGVRGVFLKTSRFETDFSLFGNPPVEDDNDARRGMEELDSVVELGPSCKVYLFRNRSSGRIFYLRFAARAVASVNLDHGMDFTGRGWHGGMNLIYRHFFPADKPVWILGLNAGVDFADRDYNGYFYDVAPEEALPVRPVYRSRGGYAGCMFSANCVRVWNRDLSFAVYGKWENCNGAAFEDSPLIRERDHFTLGAAVIWKITRSKSPARG